jgi:hypothetical protein
LEGWSAGADLAVPPAEASTIVGSGNLGLIYFTGHDHRQLGEVAASEELIGSHGGLGGPRNQPFILYPSEWQLDEPVPLGAPAIYRNIRRWLKSIGIELGKCEERDLTPLRSRSQ